MKIQPRQSSPNVSRSRWLAYAAASAATLLAGRQTAEATIHYSGVLNVRLPRGQDDHATFPLDKAGDSLQFDHIQTDGHSYPMHFAGFKVVLKNGADGSFRGPGSIDFAYVSRLRQGDVVSQGVSFTRGFGSKDEFGTLASFFDTGYFIEKGLGYIGFRFNSENGLQYGWARVRMLGSGKANAFEVIDYAWGDPGDKIACGQKNESDSAAPALGSLGLLSLGAAALVAWRKRRREQDPGQ